MLTFAAGSCYELPLNFPGVSSARFGATVASAQVEAAAEFVVGSNDVVIPKIEDDETSRSMRSLADKASAPSLLLAAAIMLLLASLGSSTGCARRALRPSELPVEYQVAPTKAANTIDLSQLARYAVSSQLIDRGDVLEVALVTDYESLQPTVAPVRVGEDGKGDIPLIGKVELAGLELEEAEQAIASAAVARGLYRNPHVTVTMKRQRSNRVTVVGAVKTAGVYELPRGSSTLLAAVVAAGGLTDDAGLDVEIRQSTPARNVPAPAAPDQPRIAKATEGQLASFEAPAGRPLQTVHVNLVSATQEGSVGYTLHDGDVVMVPQRPPRALHVLGLVQKPGEIEIPPGEDIYLLDAISKVGGLSTRLADDVLIIRRGATSGEPVQIRTSLRRAKEDTTANLRLAPGDVVSVEETPATFVWDFLRSVIRFGISGSVPLF